MSEEVRRVSAREGYDLWAETYDETPNPIVLMDARHSVRVLTPIPGELVLDAGCGTGRNLQPLLDAGAYPVGVDFSAGMLAVAHKLYPDVPLVVADLQQPLPFADESFDAALCALVGEHLENLASLLLEFRRVLRPGGRLLFSVYHPELAATGIEANFELRGVEYRLGAITYSVQDYLDMFSDIDFAEIAFASFKGDEKLASALPKAARYIGQPLLFVVAVTTPIGIIM